MKFVVIPPGESLMGSSSAELDEILKVEPDLGHWKERIQSEAPVHKVVLTQPFYFGVHEVTQAQYERVMGKNPSQFARTGQDQQFVDRVANLDTKNNPVEFVCWNDAAEFCSKLSELENLKPFYSRNGDVTMKLDGNGYRLPTEAEWEFAARAGTNHRFAAGDMDNDAIMEGWNGTNSGQRTHAVGELKRNPFGLFDVHGNVREWVEDCWEPTYYSQFALNTAIDPIGTPFGQNMRVLRGGSWSDPAIHGRRSSRSAHDPTYADNHFGFRVVRVIDR